MTTVIYRAASTGDLAAVGRVYLRAFDSSLQQLSAPHLSELAVADVIGACLLAEPDCVGVAEAQPEGRIIGYVIAISDVGRIRGAVLGRGLLLAWLGRWLTGRYRLPLRSVWHLLADKLSFWRAARLPGAHCPRILSVAVDPDWQRQGVARTLLPGALSRLRAKGCDCVRLEVRPENEAARRLYESFGFQVAGRFQDSRGFWDVMTLDLRDDDA